MTIDIDANHIQPRSNFPDDTLVKHVDVAERLRSAPGEWFRIHEAQTLAAASSFAHQISIGRRAAFRPKGAFEGRTSHLEVYARFVA